MNPAKYGALVPSFVAECELLVELDPRFGPLVEAHGPVKLGRKTLVADRFMSLSEAIAYQQLNGTAAATIWGRVRSLVDGPFEPEAVLALPEESLRGAGLSGSKTKAMRDLAAKVADGTVEMARMGRLDDETVVGELIQVWGIGRWTAHMFLLFDLHRLDVWPIDDYGVQVGWSRVTGEAVPPKPKALDAAGESLRPYRSLAAWYCWRAADNPA